MAGAVHRARAGRGRGMQDRFHNSLVVGTGRATRMGRARDRWGGVLTILGRDPAPARGLAEGLARKLSEEARRDRRPDGGQRRERR